MQLRCDLPKIALAVFVALAALPGAEASAESRQSDPPEPAAEVRRLEQKILRMEEAHQREIGELRERLAALESQITGAEELREGEELEVLQAEAEMLTAEEELREADAEKQRETFVGGERALQALNPEISFLGDFSYDWTDGPVKDGFLVRGVELGFQAPLDPYTRFKGFLAGHHEPYELLYPHDHGGDFHVDEGEEVAPGEEHSHAHTEKISVNVEEAYMEWVALPFNSRLRVGKFRQQYGTLNRWHHHALPTVESPFALQNVFGHEGLVGIGIGIDWQLPRLWASSNGLTVEVTNADNPVAFAGSDWNDPAFLIRHSGFFDFGPDAYLDLGLNWTFGPSDEAGDRTTNIYGADLNYLWEPVNRAKYRNLELRGEYIHTRFETENDGTISSDSFYLYVSSKLSRRWTLGLRYDNAELPWDRFELFHPETFHQGLREKGWTPFVTFWQSEFVRLRLQYQHTSRDFVFARGGEADNKLWIQVTFAAGPHKHESY